MRELPYVDLDYCQFSDWGYQKPSRIWGSHQISALDDRLCDGRTCPNLVPMRPGQSTRRPHWERLGGNHLRIKPTQKARIPSAVVEYLAGFTKNLGEGTRSHPHKAKEWGKNVPPVEIPSSPMEQGSTRGDVSSGLGTPTQLVNPAHSR